VSGLGVIPSEPVFDIRNALSAALGLEKFASDSFGDKISPLFVSIGERLFGCDNKSASSNSCFSGFGTFSGLLCLATFEEMPLLVVAVELLFGTTETLFSPLTEIGLTPVLV